MADSRSFTGPQAIGALCVRLKPNPDPSKKPSHYDFVYTEPTNPKELFMLKMAVCLQSVSPMSGYVSSLIVRTYVCSAFLCDTPTKLVHGTGPSRTTSSNYVNLRIFPKVDGAGSTLRIGTKFFRSAGTHELRQDKNVCRSSLIFIQTLVKIEGPVFLVLFKSFRVVHKTVSACQIVQVSCFCRSSCGT